MSAAVAVSVREVAGGRHYRAAVPARADAGAVVLLHGAGGTAAWAAHETRFDGAAARFGFVAAYPDAVPLRPLDPPAFLSNPPVWNDGSDRWPRPSPPDDVAYLNAVLDDLIGTGVDAARIHIAGFSNGAAMAFRFAAEMGERVASLIAVAGYCHARAAVKPVPTAYLIGGDDPLVPLSGGSVASPWTRRVEDKPPVAEVLARWAVLMGCAARPTSVRERDGVSVAEYAGPVALTAVTVAGLGHHWPGGRGQLKRKLAGPPSDRFDANRFIGEWVHGGELNAE